MWINVKTKILCGKIFREVSRINFENTLSVLPWSINIKIKIKIAFNPYFPRLCFQTLFSLTFLFQKRFFDCFQLYQNDYFNSSIFLKHCMHIIFRTFVKYVPKSGKYSWQYTCTLSSKPQLLSLWLHTV